MTDEKPNKTVYTVAVGEWLDDNTFKPRYCCGHHHFSLAAANRCLKNLKKTKWDPSTGTYLSNPLWIDAIIVDVSIICNFAVV